MARIELCRLCPRQCGVTRLPGRDEGPGFCKMGADALAARSALHFWEEPCISGTRGSGTIFFAGCSLQCVFCQNYALSHQGKGKRVSIGSLRRMMDALVEQGAHNINLVNPTHFAAFLAQTLTGYRPGVPVVYNSSGYESPEGLALMEGKVDVYLPDFKYFDDRWAQRYSHAPDYFAWASRALEQMVAQVGAPQMDGNGMLRRGVLVRHLVLPGHSDDSLRLLDWLESHFAGQILLSVMFQYTPFGEAAQYPEINRRLTTLEYQRVTRALEGMKLEGYVQERASASEEYIPDFAFQGVIGAEQTAGQEET